MQLTYGQDPEIQGLIEANVIGRGFFIRALSYLIDMVLLVLVNGLASAVFSLIIFVPVARLWGAAGRDFTVADQVPAMATWLLALVLSIIYTGGMEAAAGATVGKLILGMRVVTYDGRYPTFGQGLLRGVLRLADGLVFGAVAAVQMKWPLHQRLGDKIAHTLVVPVGSSLITEWRPWWVFVAAFLGYCAISGLSSVLLALTTLHLG